jgi:hypothetical protein
MFQVKRFKQLDDLLLEASIINYGNEFNAMAQEYDGDNPNSSNATSEPNPETWNKLDILLDNLLAQRIVDLDNELQRPIYEREFGSVEGKRLCESYLAYCKIRINRLGTDITTELANDEPDSLKLEQLNRSAIQIVARIEVLEKIYTAFKLLGNTEGPGVAEEMSQKITDIKNDIATTYMEPLVVVSTKVKTEISNIQDTNTQEPEKIESSKKIIQDFNTLEQTTTAYPPEVKEGVKQAKIKAERTIRTAIGDQKFEQIHEEILANDHEAGILRRILDLRYRNFTSEDEIYKAGDGIKISINGLQNPKGIARSRPEVIAYLQKQLAEILDDILKKARDKSISVDKTKGIHYDFNTRLKLHQAIDLPVTGKQIADASVIMKMRKRLASIMSLFIMGTMPTSAAHQAFSEFGKQVHNIYAVSVNSTAKLIGKAMKGREGELKADAFSRLFIPNPNVLDRKSDTVSQKLTEDGGAPGVAMQTPGSISGMGPISAPTRTSVGSGDNFSPSKTKKKKKYKSPFESQVKVFSFSTFVKENNNPK